MPSYPFLPPVFFLCLFLFYLFLLVLRRLLHHPIDAGFCLNTGSSGYFSRLPHHLWLISACLMRLWRCFTLVFLVLPIDISWWNQAQASTWLGYLLLFFSTLAYPQLLFPPSRLQLLKLWRCSSRDIVSIFHHRLSNSCELGLCRRAGFGLLC